MINSDKYFENTFSNELYNAIYAGILQYSSETTIPMNNIQNRLESPQKEQFISLFTRLKLKPEPLDTNYVLYVFHDFLQQNKLTHSISSHNQIGRPEKFDHKLFQNNQNNKIIPKSSQSSSNKEHKDDNVVSLTFSKDTLTQFKRDLFSNLTQCSQGMEWINMDENTMVNIPNLEFIITQITELGRLYNIVKNYVNVDNEHYGRVAKTLRLALQKEINLYYVYVNMWLHNNLDTLGQSDDSLYKFVPLDLNVLIRFQCLAEIVTNVKGKNGCNLISSLVHSNICEIENKILNEITKPIQEMIIRWMTYGEVKNDYGEFFIAETASENYCHNSYTLSSTNKLDFLNECQLNAIYQTGKNMRFLLEILGSEIYIKIETLRENIKNLSDGDGLLMMLISKCNRISTTLSDICAQSSVILMEVLTDRCDLYLQFEAFRNYMLLGRGDFYAYVISKLESFFGQNEMYFYQLKNIMKNGYNLTSAVNDKEKLFNNLKYTIKSTGEINWNSFKFEYVTNKPLHRIFGPCFNHYVNIFEFLWRLKKVNWILNKMWYELVYFVKIHNTMVLKPVSRNISAILSSMLNCINEIQNFMFEMINREWEQFKSETYKATCIKTVTDAHMSFLESITKYADNASVSLDVYVKSLVINADNFTNIFQCLVNTFESSFEDREIKSYDKRIKCIYTLMDKFNDVKKTYELTVCDLLSKLKKSEIQGLETLALRIDYNSYYTFRMVKN